MTPLRTNSNHASLFELEAWLSGETSQVSENLADHLGACPECKARIARMQSEGERFRFRNPDWATLSVRTVRPTWTRRWMEPLRPNPRPFIVFASLALLAIAAAVWIPRDESGAGSGFKGSPAFLLFNAKQAHFEGGDTVSVSPGDSLQIAILSDATLHYRVFSRAEDGSLTQLMPAAGEPDTLPASPKGRPLLHSLVFATPVTPERLICVWSRPPLDAAKALAILGHVSVTPQAGVDSFQVVPAP